MEKDKSLSLPRGAYSPTGKTKSAIQLYQSVNHSQVIISALREKEGFHE